VRQKGRNAGSAHQAPAYPHERDCACAATIVRVTDKGLVAKRVKSRASERALLVPSWCVELIKARRVRRGAFEGPVFPDSRGGWRDRSNVGAPRFVGSAVGRTSSGLRRIRTGRPLPRCWTKAVRPPRMIADQPGHSRVSMTQDIYLGDAPRTRGTCRRWRPGTSHGTNPRTAASDAHSANLRTVGPDDGVVSRLFGRPRGTRTHNPRILCPRLLTNPVVSCLALFYWAFVLRAPDTRALGELQAFRSRGGVAHLTNSDSRRAAAALGIDGLGAMDAFDVTVKRLTGSLEAIIALLQADE
jgi:hypothetical protein